MTKPKKSPAPGLTGAPAGQVQSLALVGEHALELVSHPDYNVLRIVAADLTTGVSVRVTQQGITVQITGISLTLASDGPLRLVADDLSLHGRNALSVTSGGDATIEAGGDLHCAARTQNIRARLGSVEIQANDDVKLTGERIKLNA